jgi:Secretion system C-terminal sorting domain
MQKIITKITLAILLISMGLSINAQTVLWPSATDTNQIKASKFTGGPNGWVTTGLKSGTPITGIDSTMWVWDISDINLKKGSFFNTRSIAGSTPSSSDGYMAFNSDYLDSRGNYNAVTMTGLGTGQSVAPHSAELISPIMDLTGSSNFKLSFGQYLREFQSQYFVTWSEDGGTTWKTPIEINKNVQIYELNSDPQSITLPGSIGTNKVRVKFIFDGNYYFWCVDDVKIVNVNKDMKINSDFYTIPINRFTPKSQVEPIFFQTDISNNGSKKATNVKLKTNVYSSTGAILFTTEKNLGTLNPSDTAQNATTFMPKLWTPPSVKGDYIGSYRIYQDSTDDFAFNDSIRFNIGISENTFAKENGSTGGIRPGGNAWTATEKQAWKWGNAYHITTPGWYQVSGTIGLSNPSTVLTKLVSTWLYKFTGDANLDSRIGTAERVRIATGDLIIPSNQPANTGIFTVPMNDQDNDQIKCVKLDTGTYLYMIEYNPVNLVGDGLFIASSTTYNYSATKYVVDSLLRITRLQDILGGFSTNKDDWSTAGFTGGSKPLARLNIFPSSPSSSGCILSNADILSDENKLSLYPNPVVADEISVTINITKLSKNASLEIYDITGKYMSGMKITNVKNNNYTMNVNDLANGTYFVKLTTEEGHKTAQFSVQK